MTTNAQNQPIENLKTLKDIEKDILERYREVGDEDNFTFPTEELKIEARRWIVVIEEKIKAINELELQPQTSLQKIATQQLDEILGAQIKIFVDFFNLEDKDD